MNSETEIRKQHVLNTDKIKTLDDCKKILKFLCNHSINPLPKGIEYGDFSEVEKYFDQEDVEMNKNGEEFIKQCRASGISVSAFIRLFNLWDRMDFKQREEVIDSEIKKGMLFVEK